MATKKYIPEHIMPIAIYAMDRAISQLIRLAFEAAKAQNPELNQSRLADPSDPQTPDGLDLHMVFVVDHPEEEFSAVMKRCILRLAGCRTSLYKFYCSAVGISNPQEFKDPRKLRRVANELCKALVAYDPESTEEPRLRLYQYLTSLPYLFFCLGSLLINRKIDLKIAARERISRDDLPQSFYDLGSYKPPLALSLLKELSKNVWAFCDSALELINHERITL